MKSILVKAMRSYLQGNIEKHVANVRLHLSNTVGVAEHSDHIETIEKELGIKADMKFKPIQPGDVLETHADTSSLEKWIGYKPITSLEKGIKDFCKWYLEFYNYQH